MLWSHPLPTANPTVCIAGSYLKLKEEGFKGAKTLMYIPWGCQVTVDCNITTDWETMKKGRIGRWTLLVAKWRKSDCSEINWCSKSLTRERLCEYFPWSTSKRELELTWLLPKNPNWESKGTAKCRFQESTRNTYGLFEAKATRLIAVRENSCGSSKAKFIRLMAELDRVLVVS